METILVNDRVGEHLWSEWDGELYESDKDEPLVYYTFEHVDIDNDIVKRALASSLQRDGIADSLSDAFKMIEKSTTHYGWGGHSDEEIYLTVCDETGETHYGDKVDILREITFVEF